MLAAGAEFGAFRILGVLGQGGMGSVYHAFQSSPPREVALKVIGPDLAAQPSFRLRFRREAEVLARLEHPNILPLYETGEIDGRPYICSRYIRGGTLKDRLGHPLTPAEAAALLEPVAEALDFAHNRGVIHRDIKPSNILLTDPDSRGRRTPIVADFGLARLLDPGSDGGAQPQLTQIGMGLGTPSHMAPEQVLGYPLDGRADQYALAITAFQLLTGVLPFSAATPTETAIMQVKEPPPPPSLLNPSLEAAVDAVVTRALAKKPEERYASCTAFISALAEAAHAGGGAPARTVAAFPLVPAQPRPTIAVTQEPFAAPDDRIGPLEQPPAIAVPAIIGDPSPPAVQVSRTEVEPSADAADVSFGHWQRPEPEPMPELHPAPVMPPTVIVQTPPPSPSPVVPERRRRFPRRRLTLLVAAGVLLVGGVAGGAFALQQATGGGGGGGAGPREVAKALRDHPIAQGELPPAFRPTDVVHFDPNTLEAQFHEADEVTYNLLAAAGETDRLNYLLFSSAADAAGYARADMRGGFNPAGQPQALCRHTADGSTQGATLCDLTQGTVVVEAISFVRTTAGQGNDANATQLVQIGVNHLKRVAPK